MLLPRECRPGSTISEHCLEMPITRKERKALAQARCGLAPLRPETGHWEKCNFALSAPDLKVHRENLLLKTCTVLPAIF